MEREEGARGGKKDGEREGWRRWWCGLPSRSRLSRSRVFFFCIFSDLVPLVVCADAATTYSRSPAQYERGDIFARVSTPSHRSTHDVVQSCCAAPTHDMWNPKLAVCVLLLPCCCPSLDLYSTLSSSSPPSIVGQACVFVYGLLSLCALFLLLTGSWSFIENMCKINIPKQRGGLCTRTRANAPLKYFSNLSNSLPTSLSSFLRASLPGMLCFYLSASPCLPPSFPSSLPASKAHDYHPLPHPTPPPAVPSSLESHGWRVDSAYTDEVTHAVCGADPQSNKANIRSAKYLRAVAEGKWVVNEAWLQECKKKRGRAEEEAFEIAGDKKSTVPSAPRRSRMAHAESVRELTTRLTDRPTDRPRGRATAAAAAAAAANRKLRKRPRNVYLQIRYRRSLAIHGNRAGFVSVAKCVRWWEGTIMFWRK